MPRRQDIKKIMIVGSGPIVIGQACEFDYSGTQACKALKEEGYEIVLLNSNPATIMTDPGFADRTYIEPITPEVAEQIIAREKPDVLLPTLGGQTALNLAVALARNGALARHGVELIGAQLEAIEKAEDRQLFKEAMERIGVELPSSGFAATWEEARGRRPGDRLPGHHPPSFTLGGEGGGVAYNLERVRAAGAAGPDALAHPHHPLRGVGHRVEGVRAGGDARPARTTSSSSAPSRTSTPWASTPATRSPWPRPRP